MFFVEHPVGEILLVDEVVAVVSVTLFVSKSLVFAPVVVFELVEYVFADGIGDVLEHSQFRVHHTFDAYGVYILGSCHGYASCLWIRVAGFVVFEGEVVHILIFVCAYDVAVYLVRVVDEENAGKEKVAYHLGQFGERVDGESVLIYVTVYSESVCHTFYPVRVVVGFASASYVLRFPCSGLQCIEFVEGCIAVLVVSALVHVALG